MLIKTEYSKTIDLMLSPGSLSICTASWSDWKESPAHFAQACDLGSWPHFAVFQHHHRGSERALVLGKDSACTVKPE